jgi:uncharacterized membrane protein YheB (UPF0754 family)
MSSLCSDTADDVLWGINDVEEDENEAVEDISKIPKSLSWISSKKGYESYRKVLERIALNTYGQDTAQKVEQTIAQELLNSSEKNMEVVFALLKVISSSFSNCYKNVEHINCPKNKVIQLERNFASVTTSTTLCESWSSLLRVSGLKVTSEHCNVVLDHILQHFWSCLVLYESKGLSHTAVENDAECLATMSTTTSVENIELQAIKEHSGWVCKRVRDTFKDGEETYKLKVSKTNNNCIDVPKQYIMDLVKCLGEDKFIQPGKFLFIPTSETITFFVYLHTVVEKIVKVALEQCADKDILKHCVQVLSESSELREKWAKVLYGEENEVFRAACILILQRIVSMFVKSKQQIIREQLQLKAQKHSTSFRQSLKKTKSVKNTMKQPSEKQLKTIECVRVFRRNPEDPNCVTVFLTEAFKNSADAPNILSKLHGCELSRILKSLGLPGYAGKSKKKQIDTLMKHQDGNAWIIAFPDKVCIIESVYRYKCADHGLIV